MILYSEFYLSGICIFLFLVLGIGCAEKKQVDKEIFNTPIFISLNNTGSEDVQAGEPFLYTDHKGKTFLSWIEKRDSISALKYSVWMGESWSEAKLIASGKNWFVNWADYPQLSSFKDGTLAAFFLEKSGTGPYAYDIKMTFSKDGNKWQEPFVLHDDQTETEHGFVSMIPWEDDLFVSWLDGRNTASSEQTHSGHDHGHGGAMTLRGARIDVQGMKKEEWELDGRVCDCCQTTAVLTAEGPLVIFRDRSEEEVRDLGMVRFTDGSWTQTMPVYNDFWKVQGCPVNGPRADAIGNNVVVAWYAAANDRPEVKVSFSTDGGKTFENPVRIDLGKTIGRVDLVLMDDSTAVVSWMEAADIKARIVRKSNEMGPVMTLASSSEKRSSGFPQIAKNGREIFFAWTDDGAGFKNLKTARIIIE